MKEINSVGKALKFCEKMGYEIEEVEIKYIIHFPDSKDAFNFADDEDLIDWCEEDRQKAGV